MNMREMEDRPAYIAVEGVDGAGKSTITGLVRQRMWESGYPITSVREVGSTRFAEECRKVLLSNEAEMLSQAALVAAARSSTVCRVKSLMAGGVNVISDRSLVSSFVYQYETPESIDLIDSINHIVVPRFPDIIIFLDITAEESMKRLSGRAGAEDLDALDSRSIEEAQERIDRYHQVLHAARLGEMKWARSNPPVVIMVDAMRPTDEIVTVIEASLRPYLQRP